MIEKEMENKIEVGEYVKTKKGYIGKIIDIDENNRAYYLDCCKCVSIENIVKHSKNKLNLLESEDIVVLEYYVRKYGRRIKRKFGVFKAGNLISFNNAHCDFLYNITKKEFLDGKGYNPKIKSIVTKEQFESVEYKN